METVKTKRPVVIGIIIASGIAVLSAIIFLIVFLTGKGNLDRALKNLDIEDESTVIRLMELGGDDPDIVMTVIDEYRNGAYYTDAARLLLYYTQYLDNDDSEAIDKLSACYKALGCDDGFISQFESGKMPTLSDYNIVDEYNGSKYGIGKDGVYTEFLSGTAKAKISAIIPRSLAACPSGVYVIDSSDSYLKMIKRDGSGTELKLSEPIKEFVLFESYVYYIDRNGKPHGPNEVTIEDTQTAMNVRIENGKVLCTLYDSDYNKIKDIIL